MSRCPQSTFLADFAEQEFNRISNIYGNRSVASVECCKVAVLLALQEKKNDSDPGPRFERLVRALSWVFGHTRVNSSSEWPSGDGLSSYRVLSLPDGFPVQRYERHATQIANRLVRVVDEPQDLVQSLQPLLTYPYVVLPDGSTIICTVAGDPADTITPRSSANGRIVHPVLAARAAFEVVAAGELMIIQHSEGSGCLLTSASGHYRPDHLTAMDVASLVGKWGQRAFREAVVVTPQSTLILSTRR